MKLHTSILMALALVALVITTTGFSGCETRPTPDQTPSIGITPEDIVEVIQDGAHLLAGGISAAEGVMTLVMVPDGIACRVADVGRGILKQVSDGAPSIVAFVEVEGGELIIPPQDIDSTRCEAYPHPDWYPLVEIPDQWQTLIEAAVSYVLAELVDIISAAAPGPEEGDAYYAARVGLSMVRHAADGGVVMVLDWLTGAPLSTLPGYSLSWDAIIGQPDTLAGAPTTPAVAPIMATKSVPSCSQGTERDQAFCDLQVAAQFLH